MFDRKISHKNIVIINVNENNNIKDNDKDDMNMAAKTKSKQSNKKDDTEYFVMLNVRGQLIPTYLTKDKIVEDVYKLSEDTYVYEKDREGDIKQILDLVALDEKIEPVSLTTLAEQIEAEDEFEKAVDKLLKNSRMR